MTARPPTDPGRLIVPALRAGADGGFSHEAARLADALDLGAGGFIVFGGTVESVRRLTADLLRRAGRPLLIASDLERGAGQQVAGLTQFPPPLALASLGDASVVRWAGAVTAQEARAVGINWVFAPVGDLDVLPDNPIVQTRAFGGDPNRVASLVRTWIEGCQGAGALACAKHFPGHGRTTVDSHLALPVVADTAATLRETDLLPFAIAVESGVASVMT
ncbi:MAG: glycoside hydrolase family 3 N-terminal domain-containing protein, partial [Gemmatimonadales bacterium]